MPKFIRVTPDSDPAETRPGDRVGTYLIMLFVTAFWKINVNDWIQARQNIEINKKRKEQAERENAEAERAE